MTDQPIMGEHTTPEGERGFANPRPTPTMGELPAAGDTAPAARTAPADHSSTLTLQQAVERSGVSIATWRRRLAQGKVAGAYKAAGAAGEQWFIPVTALADERLKALDQLHATMRALGAGLQAETAPAQKPARRWFKRK